MKNSLKNSLNYNTRSEQAEERMHEPKDSSMESIQFEEHKEKRMKKNKQSLRYL